MSWIKDINTLNQNTKLILVSLIVLCIFWAGSFYLFQPSISRLDREWVVILVAIPSIIWFVLDLITRYFGLLTMMYVNADDEDINEVNTDLNERHDEVIKSVQTDLLQIAAFASCIWLVFIFCIGYALELTLKQFIISAFAYKFMGLAFVFIGYLIVRRSRLREASNENGNVDNHDTAK